MTKNRKRTLICILMLLAFILALPRIQSNKNTPYDNNEISENDMMPQALFEITCLSTLFGVLVSKRKSDKSNMHFNPNI